MRCPSCEHETDAGAKFCEACGAKLVRVCPSCGQQAKPTARFCPECGIPLPGQPSAQRPPPTASPSQPPASYTPKHLAERIRAEQAAMEARGATEGERKIITALFADLKGSTALIESLDPEEARALI